MSELIQREVPDDAPLRSQSSWVPCKLCGNLPTEGNTVVWCDKGAHSLIQTHKNDWNALQAPTPVIGESADHD